MSGDDLADLRLDVERLRRDVDDLRRDDADGPDAAGLAAGGVDPLLLASQGQLPGLDVTGWAPPSRELSQWYTPHPLARRLVRWGLGFDPVRRGEPVLEPSLGRGAIVEALLGEGVEYVVGVDIDARNVTPWGEHPRVTVHHADFGGWHPEGWAPGDRPFRLAVMNPPYERDADVQHILHALELASAATALVRSALLHVRRAEVLRPHVVAVGALTGRPKFDGAVDGSPISDFVFIHVRARRRSRGVPVHFGWIV